MEEQVWSSEQGLVALLGSLASLLGSRVHLASVGCTALVKGLILSASETSIRGEGGGGVGGEGIGGEGGGGVGEEGGEAAGWDGGDLLLEEEWGSEGEECFWRKRSGSRMKERVGLGSWVVWRGGSNPDESAGDRLLCGGESCSWGGGRVRGGRQMRSCSWGGGEELLMGRGRGAAPTEGTLLPEVVEGGWGDGRSCWEMRRWRRREMMVAEHWGRRRRSTAPEL